MWCGGAVLKCVGRDQVFVFADLVLRACSEGDIYTCAFWCSMLRHERIIMGSKK
jgi:hypothetical protein